MGKSMKCPPIPKRAPDTNHGAAAGRHRRCALTAGGSMDIKKMRTDERPISEPTPTEKGYTLM